MKISSLKFLFLGVGFYFLLASMSYAAPTFTKELGIRLSSAAPQDVIVSTTSIYRMYFIRNYVVLSATSSNQLDWSEEPGVRLSSTGFNFGGSSYPITGCSLLPLNTQGFRMLYTIGVGTGPFVILIATSADGLAFGSSSGADIFSSSGTVFVGSPKLTELTGGNWRLFFIQDINDGNDEADKSVFTSLSTDQGATWSAATLVTGPAGDVALSTRTDGRVRVLYTAPLSGGTTNSTILSGLSNTGVTSINSELGVRLSTNVSEGGLSSPAVVRSTESFRYRMFYNYTQFASTIPSPVFSALTMTPDPQSITPSTVLNTDAATAFTISGEIFSSTPTTKLTLTGQTDITGTGVSRTNDQTITATFNPNGVAIGNWTVVVTNDDLQIGSLTDGLLITFASATVDLIDNLLRPRLGTTTQINVTIFNPGRVIIRLYTMDGHLVKTLLDQDETTTPFTVTWDGKNSDGGTVASGVYFLTFDGPKLNTQKKIVVIR